MINEKLINWSKEFNVAITICDHEGKILEMNDKACETFAKDGGIKLVGQSVFDCHPERAQKILKGLLENQQTNCYTIEKNSVKKLIYQAPWYENGKYSGFIEFSLTIPFEIPHFIRK
ncbi:MAG TPA: PAS domain-containing protein [Candidatus Bathyarchaeia archaeon]|nr:PAS domain-containing protein [Candidatus Bathyarchaeia archaeon]